MKREERLLHHKKMNKISIQDTIPKKTEGTDGEFKLCRVDSNIYLLYKDKGIWVDISGRLTGGSLTRTSEAYTTTDTRRGGGSRGRGSHERNVGRQLASQIPTFDSGWVADGSGSVVRNLGTEDFKIVQVAFNNAANTTTNIAYNLSGANARCIVSTVNSNAILVTITDGLGYFRLRLWN